MCERESDGCCCQRVQRRPSTSPDADGCLFVFSSHLCWVIHLRCEFIVAAACWAMHSPHKLQRARGQAQPRRWRGKKMLNGALLPLFLTSATPRRGGERDVGPCTRGPFILGESCSDPAVRRRRSDIFTLRAGSSPPPISSFPVFCSISQDNKAVC